MCIYAQVKAYTDKNAKNAKNGQEYTQQQLSGVTLPSSFCTTYDPWSVMIQSNMLSICFRGEKVTWLQNSTGKYP